MMKCFLTSSPCVADANALNPENGFLDRLRVAIPANARVVVVCSAPDLPEVTDFYGELTKQSFLDAGFAFADYQILDRRNQSDALKLISSADFVILMGGHVPTQNRFFAEIDLKSLLLKFDGVLMGISAGTMNCAELVYAMPEEAGEALDPDYQRFLSGLGLTKKMIIPHYEQTKDDVLDGLRVFEDIGYADSFGRQFYVFYDGTYLEIENGVETIHGKAYLLADGIMTEI